MELFEVDRFVSFLRDIVKQTWVACTFENEMFINFELGELLYQHTLLEQILTLPLRAWRCGRH